MHCEAACERPSTGCGPQWLRRRYDLRLEGAAIAFVASNATYALVLSAYLLFRHVRQAMHRSERATWPGWVPRQALSGWGLYLRYALPSAAMICAEVRRARPTAHRPPARPGSAASIHARVRTGSAYAPSETAGQSPVRQLRRVMLSVARFACSLRPARGA